MVSNVPPPPEKRYWRRYIDMWISYALHEELDAGDAERAREVYRTCLRLIPHDEFSFAKVWLLAAHFELRQHNLDGARKILGTAIAMAPKEKIFKSYIEMELQLGNVDRCRKLHEKYLNWSPQNWHAWVKYAELERVLGETERVRALFELAIGQPELDVPELLWKAYIDFEISEGEFDRTRQLYKRFLDWTKQLKVWISYAKFEAEKNHSIENARMVFSRAADYLGRVGVEEERSMLLEEWLNMETSFGDLGDVSLVQSKLPRKRKWNKMNLKLLEVKQVDED